MSSARSPLSGIRVREKKTSSTGAVIDDSRTCWKFASVTSREYAEWPTPDGAGAAEAPPEQRAGGWAGRLSAERSIAPGRENGCCVMPPLFRAAPSAANAPCAGVAGSLAACLPPTSIARHRHNVVLLVRFGVVGASGVLVNLVTLVLVKRLGPGFDEAVLGLPIGEFNLRWYHVYSTIAFFVANLWNFQLNRSWTFRSAGHTRRGGRSTCPFLAVGLAGQAIGLALLTSLLHPHSLLSLPTDRPRRLDRLPHPPLLGAADRDRGGDAAVLRDQQALDLRRRPHPPQGARRPDPHGRWPTDADDESQRTQR